jgi:hypothetical protein
MIKATNTKARKVFMLNSSATAAVVLKLWNMGSADSKNIAPSKALGEGDSL